MALLLFPLAQAHNTHRADLIASSPQWFQAADSSSLDIRGDITIEAWAKPISFTTYNVILAKENEAGGLSYSLLTYPDGRIRVDLYQNDTTFRYAMTLPGALQLNTWQHVAATYEHSTNTVHIYVNGVDMPFQNGGGVITGIQDTAAPLTIGARLNGAAIKDRFNGSLDEVRLWSIVRSRAQIRAAMFSELAGTEAGLSACWKLNNSLVDSSSNENTLSFHDASLKALYHMEDTVDSSGSGFNLTNNGGVAFNPGRFGNGADLGSANSSKHLSTIDDLGGSLFHGSSSWSLWFNASAQPLTNTEMELMGIATYSGSIQHTYRIQYTDVAGVKKIQWSRGNYGGTDTILTCNATLATGTWHHLVLVYDDAANMVLGYLDGALVASGQGYNNASSGGSLRNLTIGAWKNPPLYTSGIIDEVAVFGRALAPHEIKFLSTDAYSAGAFAFSMNDLPFFSEGQQLPLCPDTDSELLLHLDNSSADSTERHVQTVTAIQYSGANGKFSSGASLNGTTSAIEVGSNFALRGQQTYLAWVRPSSIVGLGPVFEKADPGWGGEMDCILTLLNGGRPEWLVNTDDGGTGILANATASAGLQPNEWHLLTCVVDADHNEIRLYVNGVREGTGSLAGRAVRNTARPFRIGKRISSQSTHYFAGNIDEVAVLNRALLDEEVMKYYGGIVSARFRALPGDGSILASGNSDWAASRGAAAGTEVYGNATSRQGGLCGVRGDLSPDYVERGFFPFNTSGLPDERIEIVNAVFSIVPTIQNTCPFYVTPQEQSSVETLSSADFSAVTIDGSPRWSEAVASPNLGSRVGIPLNSSGRRAVSQSGFTRLGTRGIQDLDGSGEGQPNRHSGVFFSESGANAPYLAVEYVAVSDAPVFKISGDVVFSEGGNAPIFVVAGGGDPVRASGGLFEITILASGTYSLSAFVDENLNGTRDALEPFGSYAGNPLQVIANASDLIITIERPVDSDGDEMADAWEKLNGLVVGVSDASADPDGDGLSNLWEWLLQTQAKVRDSDANGTDDGVEDADGDGLRNVWEVRHGLNPMLSNKDQSGDGSDGILSVPLGQTLVLAPFATTVAGLNPVGATSVSVADDSGFEADDLILFWIAQDPNPVIASNTAGRYQICRIVSKGAGTLNLLKPLTTALDAGTNKKIVAQRVPEYTVLSIDGIMEPQAWNGEHGGVLAFCSRRLVVGASGKIHANGKGFRGGGDYALADVDGFQGESFVGGYGVRSVAANASGGGGGGRSWHYAGNGGGGAGYGFAGTSGGYYSLNPTDRPTSLIGGAAGASSGQPSLTALLLGSGGGSGGQDGDGPEDVGMNGGQGGFGGGAVILITNEISNGGTISCNGESGADALPLSTERGGGGGGSGGLMYIIGNYSGLGTLEATGGVGGKGVVAEIAGGTGGSGRIRCDLKPGIQSPAANPAIGYVGVLSDAFLSSRLGLASYDDADLDGLNTLMEALADTNPFKSDTDDDGLPDLWEVNIGTSPTLPDAAIDLDTDGLTNLQEFHQGTKADLSDTDNDGLTDGIEAGSSGTSPLLSDTDSDGMPDKWEADHGLDPRKDDRHDDRDLDFLTNLEEFTAGLNPASADSDGNGTTDYKQLKGKTTWEALYDRNDRLLGVRHERGASFGYRYDGNSNLVRQVKLGRDSDKDGLSDLWEFANGLDPESATGMDGLAGDRDSDGWTNYQELVANSNPALASSRPGVGGTVLASIPFPFTPTRFVIGTGQLDASGSDEIVVSADGNPLGGNNFLRLFREGDTGWVHEDIPIGDYGVTSLAIGSVGARQGAVYAGLRKAGGEGRVIEITRSGTNWRTNVVSECFAEGAWVHGIRRTPGGTDLLLGLYTRFGPNGAVYRAIPNGAVWAVNLLDPNASYRGQGSISRALNADGVDAVARRLDSGGVQIAEAFSYPIPSFDEFNDTSLESPQWTSGGTLPSESGGLARMEASWTSGGSATSWTETELQWPRESAGLEIRVAFAQHYQTTIRFGGESRILIGPTAVYGSGQNRSESNIDVQALRGPSKIYFRRRVNGGVWSDWGSGDIGSKLRLEASGYDAGSNSYDGYVKLHVDYVRYRSAAYLLAQGKSANDFAIAEGAYHAGRNSWFFKTPTALSWRDAQMYAFSRGGSLTAITDSALNTWTQGKFAGEFWTGLYRNSPVEAWRQVSNDSSSFTNWSTGQPAAADDQLYASSNGGLWSSATGVELKAGVYEVKGQLAEIAIRVFPETTTTGLIPWQGRNIETGRFNPGNPGEASLVQVMLDDKDTSGDLTDGDDFVVAETVLGTPATVRTPVRRILSTTSGLGFGVTALRTRAGTSDMLATAEPDGQVCVWLPETPGGPLKRKLLSLDHVGKGWHGLEKFDIAGGMQGMAGLRTDPATPGSVELVIWNGRDLGFIAPPVIQQSPPSARLLSSTSAGAASAALSARIWDSEGNLSALGIQFKHPVSGAWTTATVTSINGNPPATGYHLPTSPAGITHSVNWAAGQDLGTGFRGMVLVRSQATDNSGSGEWSAPLAYTIGGGADTDGDGMPDAWESSNALDPMVDDATLDSDHDGTYNLMEFALGMNPRLADPSGLPRLTIEGGFATLTIARNPDASSLNFTPQRSLNLAAWDAGPDYFTVVEDTATMLKVRLNQAVTERKSCYLRLRVTK